MVRKTRIAALALCLLLALAGCGCKVNRGGEDTPYPYSWQTQSDGSLRVVISSGASPDHTWSPVQYDPNALTLTLEEAAKENSVVYALTPLTAGSTAVVFACEKQLGGLTDRIFEIRISLDVDEKLQAAVSAHSEAALETAVSNGADGALPYLCKTEADGSLSVYVTGSGIWEGQCGGDFVTLSGPFYDADGCLFTAVAEGSGSGTLTLNSGETGASLSLPVTADERGYLTVDETGVTVSVPAAQEDPQEDTDAPEEDQGAAAETDAGGETQNG